MASSSRCSATPRRLLAALAFVVLLASAEAYGAQLTASWVDNSNGAATTRVERRKGTEPTFTPIADVTPGGTSYVDASVSSGTTYCYRLLAYDATTVSPYSNEACGTTSTDGSALSVTISKAGDGTGLVTSTPAGISCAPTCAATFASTTVVTLAATPSSGSTFAGWSGGGCAGTSTCTLVGNTPVAVTASFAAASPSTTTLLLSSRADRSSPGPLAGATVAQDIFVFLSPVSASRVRFFVDDPGMTRAPFQTELYTPFDLAGGSLASAAPFDTRRIADGPHTVTAAIDLSTGGSAVASASFTVANGVVSSPAPVTQTPDSPAAYGLSVSTSPYRTIPKPLAGAVVSGPIYVFTSPDTSVTGARFFLDDPTMSGLPRQIEKNAPFDFAGGTVSVANAFNTSNISSGAHTITAALRLSSGATTVVSATFHVEAKKLVLSPTPISMSAAPGTTTKTQATVSSLGGTAAIAVGDNASWLSVTSNTSTTPATLTLMADTRNLSSGKYSATVTVSAAGFPSVAEPVTLNVGTNTSASLLLSSRADRSSPRLLSGATVAQNIFVFLGPVSASRVRFFVDDPGMSRVPFQTELNAPYDLAGGTTATATPFDTRRIPDGLHTVTAAIDLSTGGTSVVRAQFTVSNGGVTTSQPPSSGQTVIGFINAWMANGVFQNTRRSDFQP